LAHSRKQRARTCALLVVATHCVVQLWRPRRRMRVARGAPVAWAALFILGSARLAESIYSAHMAAWSNVDRVGVSQKALLMYSRHDRHLNRERAIGRGHAPSSAASLKDTTSAGGSFGAAVVFARSELRAWGPTASKPIEHRELAVECQGLVDCSRHQTSPHQMVVRYCSCLKTSPGEVHDALARLAQSRMLRNSSITVVRGLRLLRDRDRASEARTLPCRIDDLVSRISAIALDAFARQVSLGQQFIAERIVTRRAWERNRSMDVSSGILGKMLGPHDRQVDQGLFVHWLRQMSVRGAGPELVHAAESTEAELRIWG